MNEIKRDIERAENQAFRDELRKSRKEREKAIKEIEKIAKILENSLDFDIAIWDDIKMKKSDYLILREKYKALRENKKIYEKALRIRFNEYNNDLLQFAEYSEKIERLYQNLNEIEFFAEKELLKLINYLRENNKEYSDFYFERDDKKAIQEINLAELLFAIEENKFKAMRNKDKELEFSFNNFSKIAKMLIRCLEIEYFNEKIELMMLHC